jgi:hypothetical protein
MSWPYIDCISIISVQHLTREEITFCTDIAFVVGTRMESTSAYDAPNYIVSRKGNIPVILTSPHGGKLTLPGVKERSKPGIIARKESFFICRVLQHKWCQYECGSRFGSQLPWEKFSKKTLLCNRTGKKEILWLESICWYVRIGNTNWVSIHLSNFKRMPMNSQKLLLTMIYIMVLSPIS